MTDEQLRRIEQELDEAWPGVGWEHTARALIAEVRRLREENAEMQEAERDRGLDAKFENC